MHTNWKEQHQLKTRNQLPLNFNKKIRWSIAQRNSAVIFYTIYQNIK
jgi:hypothetical protein